MEGKNQRDGGETRQFGTRKYGTSLVHEQNGFHWFLLGPKSHKSLLCIKVAFSVLARGEVPLKKVILKFWKSTLFSLTPYGSQFCVKYMIARINVYFCGNRYQKENNSICTFLSPKSRRRQLQSMLMTWVAALTELPHTPPSTLKLVSSAQRQAVTRP